MVFKELLTEEKANRLFKKGGFSTKSKKEKSLVNGKSSRINSVIIRKEMVIKIKRVKIAILYFKLSHVVLKNKNSEFEIDSVERSADTIFKRFCILKPKKKRDSILKVKWYFLPLCFLIFSGLENK